MPTTAAHRRLIRVVAIAGAALVVTACVAVFWPHRRPPSRFEVIAHRGVHQPVRRDIARHETPIAMDACTAQLVERTPHGFIENTIPSIEAAFHHGATIVEIDLHLSSDGEVVVFHDYILDCRTDAVLRGCQRAVNRGQERCLVWKQPLSLLRTLDVGYGYSSDGGKTFPLRGKGVGMMPTLGEVLAAFPQGNFLLDVKGNAKEVEAVARLLQGVKPQTRPRIFWYNLPPPAERRALELAPGTQVLISDVAELKKCAAWYFTTGWLGYVPTRCRELRFAAAVRHLKRLGPLARPFIRKLHAQGSTIVVAFVETIDEMDYLAPLDVDGVHTNYIEVIGEYFRGWR